MLRLIFGTCDAPLPKTPPPSTAEVLVASADSDNDAPPEVMTSKAPLALVNHSASSIRDPALEIEIPSQKTEGTYHILADALTSNDSMTRETKPRPIKPKKAPYNPFASRPTLLRNVRTSIIASSLFTDSYGNL
jgi:hypothetical protein